MDFYKQQEENRKKTVRLFILFFLVVVALVVVTNIVMCPLFLVFGSGWNAGLIWKVSLANIAVIGIPVFFKWLSLREGGEKIAKAMRGTLVTYDNCYPQDRVLLNVVEEMAVASGIKMPKVYVMRREEGINSFAAGFSPDDAVIGVTQGALKNLNREQLQGVVAHEFSHVLNGDIRLNMIIVILLYGLTFMAEESDIELGADDDEGEGESPGCLGIVMFPFVIIGVIGTLLGNQIKKAILHKREFLADATSVQFTRNSNGLAEALEIVRKHPQRGNIFPNTLETSHMFICSPKARNSWDNPRLTHPPIEERIRALNPSWEVTDFARVLSEEQDSSPITIDDFLASQKRYNKRKAKETFQQNQSDSLATATGSSVQEEQNQIEANRSAMVLDPLEIATGVLFAPTATDSQSSMIDPGWEDAAIPVEEGDIGASVTEETDQVMAGFCSVLLSSDVSMQGEEYPFLNKIKDTTVASAVICTIFLSRDKKTRDLQFKIIDEQAAEEVGAMVEKLYPQLKDIRAEVMVVLWEHSAVVLKQISESQFERLMRVIKALIYADKKVELREWCIYQSIRYYLGRELNKIREESVVYEEINQVGDEYNIILSTLIHHGHSDPETAEVAFSRAADRSESYGAKLLAQSACTIDELDRAVAKIKKCSSLIKEKILSGLLHAASFDGEINAIEKEVIITLSVIWNCPVVKVSS